MILPVLATCLSIGAWSVWCLRNVFGYMLFNWRMERLVFENLFLATETLSNTKRGIIFIIIAYGILFSNTSRNRHYISYFDIGLSYSKVDEEQIHYSFGGSG